MLTRNIKIQASADAEQSFFGGHIMAMPSSKMYVSGVELTRMGQNLTLARYPIHWHLVGDGKGQYIRNAAIHNTYNRCVTVHGTNNLLVENNVTYNTVGHCFFLEDGIETGNQYIRNLGIQTKCHTSKPCVPTNLAASGMVRPAGNGQQSKEVLIPSDNTVSTFWITNPDNIYRDNVAAGSDAIGFWLAFPEHPIGQFEGTEISRNTWPRRTQIREFKGNIAHSNFDGLMFDRGPSPTGTFNAGGNPHMAYANPADTNSPKLDTIIEDFTSYRNRNSGIWARGEQHIFRNLKMADNGIGYTHAYPGIQPQGGAYTSKVVDSLFVGETENLGNPVTDAEKAYGRSLPYTDIPDFPIRGYEYYDFRHEVTNVTFRNYEDNATRKSGAISYLLFTSFGTSPENSIEKAKFVNAKPAYFPPMERKWGNDNGGTGWRTAAFKDKDGSLGGGPNSYIVNNIGMLAAFEGCEVKPTWNAAVCKGDIGRMNVGAGGGGGARGGGAPRAGGPGRGAAGPGAAGPAGPGGPAARAGGAGPGAGAPGAPAGPGGPAPAARAGGPAPGAGGPGGAPGARGGGAAAAPAQPPVVLSRNGVEFTPTGETFVVAGTEIKVATERPNLPISVSQLENGSWVIFQLPGFTTAASGAEQSSLDALRKA